MRILLSILLIFLMAGVALGQSSKKKKKKSSTQIENNSPTSLEPYYPSKVYQPKASKKPKKNVTYNAEQDYFERMAALEKTKRKNEKLMQLPQYSDPSYFGHKRPPKKRKPGKMKFCKECGVKH